MLGFDVVRRADPCEAKHGLGNPVLIGSGEPADGFDGLFEPLRHGSPSPRKRTSLDAPRPLRHLTSSVRATNPRREPRGSPKEAQ
ncbi:protein of unknown function; putative exported protein [Methylorubrum extorquens DM4]|uniref:Uncharacterized protein n=1 Tax=Methylorubrum extorquens (strain DSM 6343 / CIP 106787 / DM4) TaxID=661410 RepID=C7CAS2_METED|nr:protein of unknown function; putative exported protein [Methylorubrum extorquens DM4]